MFATILAIPIGLNYLFLHLVFVLILVSFVCVLSCFYEREPEPRFDPDLAMGGPGAEPPILGDLTKRCVAKMTKLSYT